MRERTKSERLVQPTVLTAAALAIGVGLVFACGAVGVVIYAMMLPVPLFLLWLSWDVQSAEERLAPPEAERVRPALGHAIARHVEA